MPHEDIAHVCTFAIHKNLFLLIYTLFKLFFYEQCIDNNISFDTLAKSVEMSTLFVISSNIWKQ